MQTCYFYL